MKSIWKFPLKAEGKQSIVIPEGAVLLDVQTQHQIPCLWALVDPEAEQETRLVITHGTGHPVGEDTGAYIGTYQINGGSLVFHVFEHV